jgi:hypothetical protein
LALQEFDSRRKEQIGLPNQGENKYLAGVTVHNMAVVNALAGRDDVALPLFQEAAKLKRRTFGKEHPEVAVRLFFFFIVLPMIVSCPHIFLIYISSLSGFEGVAG